MGLMMSPLIRPLIRLPGQWTFWADAIVGGQRLGAVDVAKFSYTSKLSAFGTGSVTVLLPSGLDSSRLLNLWSWRLWAFYAGVPVWCGVPTGITDVGQAAADLTLTELPGYLGKRVMDVSPSKVYTQVEQTTIASDLAAPLTTVGVSVVADPGAGVKRDRTYEYLQGGSRADLLTALSQVIQGPEFRAEYTMTTAGLPACTLHIAYPRVGSGSAGLGVTVPGAAVAYQAAWDADAMRTHTFAVGDIPDNAAPGTAQPVVVQDSPQPDLPRLDAVDDWPGVVLTSTLREKAQASALQQADPALTLTVTPSEANPLPITTYTVGDDVTINATTELLPGGLQVKGRLVQLDVDAAAGTAAWTVSVPMPPPKARETLTGALRRLDLTTAGIFHGGPLTILASE